MNDKVHNSFINYKKFQVREFGPRSWWRYIYTRRENYIYSGYLRDRVKIIILPERHFVQISKILPELKTLE